MRSAMYKYKCDIQYNSIMDHLTFEKHFTKVLHLQEKVWNLRSDLSTKSVSDVEVLAKELDDIVTQVREMMTKVETVNY
jgi:ACT domain-containing protein